MKGLEIEEKLAVWQDEKDFTLEVPVNLQNDHVHGKGKKSDMMKIYIVWQTRCPKKSWYPLWFHGMV